MIAPSNPIFLRLIPRPLLQQPFEILFAFLCVISGGPYVVGHPPSQTLRVVLPTALVYTWGIFLFIGGVIYLFGIGYRNHLVQRAGLSLLGPTAIVYAIMMSYFFFSVHYFTYESIISVVLVLFFGMVCLIKDYTLKIATLSIAKIFKEIKING